jgi:diguanylate cyclase (GGDEF)-like protein
VDIDSGQQMSGDSAGPAARAGTVTWLVACCVLLAAAVVGDIATSGWSLRERLLLALVAVLAVVAGLLVRRDRLTDQRLAAERRQLSIAVNNIPQGLVLYDASARIIICNQPYLDMFGLSPDVARPGCTMQRLITHRKETGSFDGDVDEFCNAIIQTVSLGKATRQLTEAPGGRAIEIINRPLKGGGWVATIEDITARQRADEKIAHLAHYDGLTDLPNRILFRERLEQSLKAIRPGEQLAVLYIDIDEFKSVNDALGHPTGDELLKGVAKRLRGCLKETDVAARLGGDEFAVIQTIIKDRSETTRLVDDIHSAIRQPLECMGHLITTDASIGIALAPGDGVDLDQLLKNADLALYGAKGDGRRTYRFFEAGMDQRARARRSLELDLRQAISDGSLETYYQPVVNLEDGKVSSCEALLRWRHPERGMISPAEFIPIAEDSGLINQLGLWVLNTACAEAATWPDHRGRAHSRRRGGARHVAPVAQAGRPDRAGRFRHRLLLAQLPAAFSVRQDQDRSLLHQGSRRSGRVLVDRPGCGEHRGRQRHDDDGGGGRNRAAAESAVHPRLHRDAGLSVQPRDIGRRREAVAAFAPRQGHVGCLKPAA